MKNIKYTFIVLFAVFFSSCDRDELLDIEPFGLSIPSTAEDFRLLLDNRDGFTAADEGRVPMYEIDFFLADEIKINDDNWGNYADSQRYADALLWQENFGTLEDEDDDWRVLNNQVLVPSIVINAMDDPEITGDTSLKNQLRAEAQVHRAFAFWSLVNLYSKQYDAATAATDIGVPIKLETDFQSSFTRASVQDVYDQILADLNAAIDSGALPSGRQSVVTRPSMAAAYAILAKTHLAMGNYQEAQSAANSSLQNYDMLLDYTSLFSMPNNFDNPELFMLKQRTASRNAPGQFTPADELLALYTPGDARANLYFRTNFATGEPEFDRNNFGGNNYICPSVSEMYLIRAECNARVGDVSAVSSDLNAIGQNRIGGYVPVANFSDRATALAYVKEERRREFAGKGVRLFDIKRYNAYDGDNISISRNILGTTYSVEGNSNRWIVPLSQALLAQDPGLEQSPR